MGVYKYIHKNLKFEICVSVLFEDATLAGPVGAFRRAGISNIGYRAVSRHIGFTLQYCPVSFCNADPTEQKLH